MILNLVQLNKQLADIQIKLESNEDKIKGYESRIKSLEDEKEKLKMEVEKEKEEKEKTSESVNKQVTQKLATIGIELGSVKDAIPTTLTGNVISEDYTDNPKSASEQFDRMPNGKAKSKFLKENRREILNGMAIQHVAENPLILNGQIAPTMAKFSSTQPQSNFTTQIRK